MTNPAAMTHNVALALDAMGACGLDASRPVETSGGPARVKPEDVVRGDLERTLGLLWLVFTHFEGPALASLSVSSRRRLR